MTKMKKVLVFMLALSMVMIFLLAGCTKKEEKSEVPESSKSEEKSPEPSEPEKSEETIPDISERAMNNFIAKVREGNYTIKGNGFIKITVYSKDLVYFDYTDNASYNDFAVMTVNGETFQGFLHVTGLTRITYYDDGNAMDACDSRILNYWLSPAASKGNIYNLFYNDMEDPLKFFSKEDIVKKSVLAMAGYGQNAMKYMDDVYLILDSEDPSEVHIQVKMLDDEVARYYFDDIDIKVEFGNAKTNEVAEAWMKNPVYPDPRTDWEDTDLLVFNSVFMPGYGDDVLPFIPSASYALKIDDVNFAYTDQVDLRDTHATEQDVEDYKKILLDSGYTKVTEDGTDYYRKMLREEYQCYASVEVHYLDGLRLTANKYYECPEYDSLEELNKVVFEK